MNTTKILLLCAATALGACHKGEGGGKGGDAGGRAGKGRGGDAGPTAVRVETAESKTLPVTLSVIATLAGRTQADVFAKVVGRLSALGAKEGEPVKAGDVLFRVDRSDPGESFLSTPVNSPIKGWIGRWYVTSLGEQVNTNDPVVTVVDDEVLRATVDLPTREWLLVAKNTAVALTVAAETRQGRIVTVARSGDAASGRGSVTVEVDNPGRTWRAGMVAKVALGLEPKPRIVIPTSALIITDQGAFVYVADGDTARRAQVKFALIDADAVEILDGVKDQEKVVVAGTNQLSDKAKLKIAGAPGDGASPPPGEGGETKREHKGKGG